MYHFLSLELEFKEVNAVGYVPSVHCLTLTHTAVPENWVEVIL